MLERERVGESVVPGADRDADFGFELSWIDVGTRSVIAADDEVDARERFVVERGHGCGLPAVEGAREQPVYASAHRAAVAFARQEDECRDEAVEPVEAQKYAHL